MATSKRDTLIVGLRNAYGAEAQAIDTLDRTYKDLEHYPELKAVVGQHLEESKRQKDALEGVLGRMGESPSALKETVMRLAGNVQGLVHMMAGDEVLKNTFTLYAYEHFEQAAYRSLIAMGQECGETDVVEVCRGILKEEEQAAEKLGALIESVTRTYMQRESAGKTASG
jgi:ferritin-like metal-binding protein YciE